MRFARHLDRFSQDLMLQGNTSDEVGFIVGDGMIQTLTGDVPRAVSIKFIREAARRIPELGLVDADELLNAEAEVGDLRESLQRVSAERAELQETLDRITGLTRDGFDIQKRRGPTPKVAA